MAPAKTLLPLLVLSLLTACGTTVPGAGSATGVAGGDQLAQGVSPDGLGSTAGGAAGPTSVAGGPAVGGGSVTAGSAGGPAAPGAAVPGTSTTGASGGAPAAAGALPAKGRGWDEKYVYIGVTTQKDVQQAFETVGVNGLNAGDQEGAANAIVAELNRRGGLFGRQIKIVFRDHKTIETAQNPSGTAQATCTYYTQDRPVVAVLSPITLMDGAPLRGCFARAKVPLFSASVASLDQKANDAYAPYLYPSVAPVWDPFAGILAKRLKAQGYFGGWNFSTGAPGPGAAKVGILIKTDEISNRVSGIISRAVMAQGVAAPEVYSFKEGNEMPSAVLQFRGRGVTHIISTDGGALLGFMLSADDQGYRPRYAISSFLTPAALLEGTAPESQLHGMTGVGWSPSVDVTDANDPGDTGPGETECKRMLARGGQTFQGKRLAEAVGYAFCDGLRLIVAAAQQAGGLTGPQIGAGAQAVGPKLHSAFGFGNGIGGGRYFLPGAVRDIAYVEKCRCFRYTATTTYPM